MVTPEKLAKCGSEESHQTAFFAWLANPLSCSIERLRVPKNPIFGAAFAIPNGGERNKIVAAKMKSQGVKAGVWDVFFPIMAVNYCGIWNSGLWIEFKRLEPKGYLTKEQKEFRELCGKTNPFDWFVAYTWIQAADKTLDYLRLTVTAINSIIFTE